MEWVIGLLLCAAGWALYKALTWKRSLVVVKCDTCTHFDLAEGQAALAKEPRFMHQVAPHVSPQRMMDRYDKDGVLQPAKVQLSALKDNWACFGACNKHEYVCHSDFKCDQWKAKSK